MLFVYPRNNKDAPESNSGNPVFLPCRSGGRNKSDAGKNRSIPFWGLFS
jgi:hypothetical protein